MSTPHQEVWRTVPGFPAYSVSSIGRVRRDAPGPGTKPGRILKRQHDNRRYPMVHLLRDRQRHARKIHQLLADAFLGPRPEWAECVAHNDGDPSNCTIENLRWATLKQNQQDRLAHGTHNRGERHGASRLSVQMLADARTRRAAGETVASIAKSFGVHRETVGMALRGKSWAWVDG